MGSECSQSKRLYDISMSKRTRKPIKLKDTDPKDTKRSSPIGVDENEDATNPRSLKEPMKPIEGANGQRIVMGTPQSDDLSTGSSEDVSPDPKDTRNSSSSKGVDEKEDATNPRSFKEPMKPDEGADGQCIVLGPDPKDTRSSSSSKGVDEKEDATNPRSWKEPMKPIEGTGGQSILMGSPQSENSSTGSGEDFSLDPKDTRSSSSKGVDENEDTTNPRSLEELMKPIEGTDGQGIVLGSPQSENPSTGSNEDVSDHRSLKLKELMINVEGDQKNGNNSLGHHFIEEEKQLQLVTKQQGERAGGVKMRGIVSRYVKVLSHLIRVKGDKRLGSQKKRVLRLTM
ncbi:RNA polymerase-associated protein CTR9 homolog [Macadamia integrifolia]|uniref:RNA polymerase-associated protein CTR9 homolog n=1 Tax=Macadamia integrifolia TaxID=60698 RepID=UPI001C5284D0|nr:RNA polymerase-associated protein CTR9 homolog [Macadamia integrifolia]